MGEIEHPYLLADQARHPVIRETASTHNKYNNYPYFRLMSGGGRGIPFMLEAPEARPSDRSDEHDDSRSQETEPVSTLDD